MTNQAKLNVLLTDNSIETQRQGMALFKSLNFEEQLNIGFITPLISQFDEIRSAMKTLIMSLSEEAHVQCWDSIYNTITIASDGTPEAPYGWVWNSDLLDVYLSRVGKELKGLRLSMICRESDSLGDLSWLKHCPILTHIDLNTVHIEQDGLEQLIRHPTLKHFELALCSLSEKEYTTLQEAKPSAKIIRTEDKVGYAFQYDENGRGCRITAALYPQHRNGCLIGVLAAVQGYAGGGDQSDWSGASIVSDDRVKWVWNFGERAPEHETNLMVEGDDEEVIPFKSIDYHGYMIKEENQYEYITISAQRELYGCLWAHLDEGEYGDQWADLIEETKSMVIEHGGFYYTSGLYCPSILLAGQSGGLLTSWRFENVDLPKARRAIAPALPSFTKDGHEPKYRMVIEFKFGYDPEEQKEDRATALQTITQDLNEKVLPRFQELGLHHILTESYSEEYGTDEAYDYIEYYVMSPKSMLELEKSFLSMSGEVDVSMTVSDLEGLTTQIFMYGDYDTGTIGLCNEFLQEYMEAIQSMRESRGAKFEKQDT